MLGPYIRVPIKKKSYHLVQGKLEKEKKRNVCFCKKRKKEKAFESFTVSIVSTLTKIKERKNFSLLWKSEKDHTLYISPMRKSNNKITKIMMFCVYGFQSIAVEL